MKQCCLSHQLQLWLMFLVFCVMCNRADILVFSAAARHQIEEEFRDMPARFGGLIPSEGIKVFDLFIIILIIRNIYIIFSIYYIIYFIKKIEISSKKLKIKLKNMILI